MSVTPSKGGFLVTVYNKNAKGRRIRKQHNGTVASARALELEIATALENYGMWPVTEGAELLKDAPKRKKRNGTLSHAARLALETHWKGTKWGELVRNNIWIIVDFLERERGKKDIDDIVSEDIDAFVKWRQSLGNGNNNINKYLSMLSVVCKVATERKPPLAQSIPPIKVLKTPKIKKWWLRPEDFEKALDWLHNEKPDPEFADFISLLVLQGFRVTEALKLEVGHIGGLGTGKPSISPPGTKTKASQNAIPVFDAAVELLERCIERAHKNRRKRLFVYRLHHTQIKWNEVRAFLGVSDVETATLRSLRRTFAYNAHQKNLSTRLIQKILRHENISTTTGYLDVVGDNDVDLARDLMNEADGRDMKAVQREEIKEETQDNDMAELIAAYRSSGAGPKEVAEFIKEMKK